MSARACTAAAAKGRLDLLQWLREEGAPWELHKCVAEAVRGAHKPLLEWLAAEAKKTP